MGSAIAMRHERPNAVHRARYYAHHWPDRAHRDLFEHPGPWVLLWAAVGFLGVILTFASPILGDEAAPVGWLNLGLLALLLVAHGSNAVRTRRRRSVLLAPVLAAAVALGVLHMARRSDVLWVDILVLVFLVWIPIAAADVAAPRSTYLARRHRHE
jgi:drug/metabolite transporter (DMT)-like permease